MCRLASGPPQHQVALCSRQKDRTASGRQSSALSKTQQAAMHSSVTATRILMCVAAAHQPLSLDRAQEEPACTRMGHPGQGQSANAATGRLMPWHPTWHPLHAVKNKANTLQNMLTSICCAGAEALFLKTCIPRCMHPPLHAEKASCMLYGKSTAVLCAGVRRRLTKLWLWLWLRCTGTHWDPLVLGPALAMDRMPAPAWPTACSRQGAHACECRQAHMLACSSMPTRLHTVRLRISHPARLRCAGSGGLFWSAAGASYAVARSLLAALCFHAQGALHTEGRAAVRSSARLREHCLGLGLGPRCVVQVAASMAGCCSRSGLADQVLEP